MPCLDVGVGAQVKEEEEEEEEEEEWAVKEEENKEWAVKEEEEEEEEEQEWAEQAAEEEEEEEEAAEEEQAAVEEEEGPEEWAEEWAEEGAADQEAAAAEEAEAHGEDPQPPLAGASAVRLQDRIVKRLKWGSCRYDPARVGEEAAWRLSEATSLSQRVRLPIGALLFTHDALSARFSHGGDGVDALVGELRQGKVRIKQLPALVVVKWDGHFWVVCGNRRLSAYKAYQALRPRARSQRAASCTTSTEPPPATACPCAWSPSSSTRRPRPTTAPRLRSRPRRGGGARWADPRRGGAADDAAGGSIV